MAKNSMISLLPRYNATRMVTEYTRNFYVPASRQGALYSDDDFSGAKKIAAWKAFVRRAWGGVENSPFGYTKRNVSVLAMHCISMLLYG